MQELIDLVAVTLGVNSSQVTEKSVAEDFARWDSLRIVLLSSMIEQTYGLTLSAQEVTSLDSVASIITAIKRHGIKLT